MYTNAQGFEAFLLTLRDTLGISIGILLIDWKKSRGVVVEYRMSSLCGEFAWCMLQMGLARAPTLVLAPE